MDGPTGAAGAPPRGCLYSGRWLAVIVALLLGAFVGASWGTFAWLGACCPKPEVYVERWGATDAEYSAALDRFDARHRLEDEIFATCAALGAVMGISLVGTTARRWRFVAVWLVALPLAMLAATHLAYALTAWTSSDSTPSVWRWAEIDGRVAIGAFVIIMLGITALLDWWWWRHGRFDVHARRLTSGG